MKKTYRCKNEIKENKEIFLDELRMSSVLKPLSLLSHFATLNETHPSTLYANVFYERLQTVAYLEIAI